MSAADAGACADAIVRAPPQMEGCACGLGAFGAVGAPGGGSHKLKGYIQVKHGGSDSRRKMLGKVRSAAESLHT